MTMFRRALIAAAALTAVGAAVLTPAAMAGDDHREGGQRHETPQAVGLTADGVLVGFDVVVPAGAREIGRVTGLSGDTELVGIDYRVQDGKLYGVGDEGGVYTLDDTRGSATKVLQLSVDLDGAFFGVDFNPAANALRVVSDTGQNLRQPFATDGAPTVVDTALTNPAVAPATGTVRGTGVAAAAYTNNDLSAATATTLFDLDTALGRVAVQSPANAGTLAPTGTLRAPIGPDAGLDIRSTLVDGRTVANEAFATVEVEGVRRLWVVDVLAGHASDLGAFPTAVTDLAVQLQP